MRSLWLCVLMLGCAEGKPVDPADTTPTDTVADTDAAVDTDAADTTETSDPIDAPEATCTDAPAELWCGIGQPNSPFVLLHDGQDVFLEAGGQGLAHFYSAIQLRNTEQAVRIWRRVTDVATGEVIHESRVLNNLVALAGGGWDCEGYLSGYQTALEFQGLQNRELQVGLCGHEVLFEMASEDIASPGDAPVVLGSGSVRFVLRPDPQVDPPVICE